jgi:hypothetical protein
MKLSLNIQPYFLLIQIKELTEERSRPLRIKACPTEKTEEQLLKIEVESNEDLEKLATYLATPIIECKRGYDGVIDARDKILFYRRREEKGVG